MKPSIHTAGEAGGRRIDKAWGSLTWLAGGETGAGERLTLGRVVIRRGCANERHAHRGCEEVLHLLAGRLEHRTGEERGILEAGDTLVVPPGLFHSAKSVGEVDAEMIVAYSSARRDYVSGDGEGTP